MAGVDINQYIDMAVERPAKEMLIWGVLASIGRPASYLDIGCRDGWMVRTMRHIGARPSLGIEFDTAARKYARKYANVLVVPDNKPLLLRNRFDLVMCMGADQRADWLVQAIAAHVTKYLVLIPRTKLVWVDALAPYDIVLDYTVTGMLRTMLSTTLPGTPMEWAASAVTVYKRG